jgi:ankyrin repeat protein
VLLIEWTPLHEAANHGFADIVKYLLEHEADIQAKGHDDTSPLHDAVFCGHYEVCQIGLICLYGVYVAY